MRHDAASGLDRELHAFGIYTMSTKPLGWPSSEAHIVIGEAAILGKWVKHEGIAPASILQPVVQVWGDCDVQILRGTSCRTAVATDGPLYRGMHVSMNKPLPVMPQCRMAMAAQGPCPEP